LALLKRLHYLLGLASAVLVAAASAGPVHDDRGRSVQLAQTPSRVVSLAPHLTELMMAAGAASRLVALDTHSAEPNAEKALPRLAAHPQPDLEALLALRPDLVLLWAAGLSTVTLNRLESLGLKVYVSDPRRLEDIPQTLERFSRLMGEAAAPEALRAASGFRQAVARLREDHAQGWSVPVFIQIWSQPLMSVGPGSVLADSLQVCGAHSVLSDARTASVRVDAETVIARAPALIVTTRADATGELWRQVGLLAPRGPAQFVAMDGTRLERASPAMLAPLQTLCAHVRARRAMAPADGPSRP
jgi:iron complex transport system substrate-binding protein